VVFKLSPSFGGWNFSILHEFDFVDFPDPAGREPIGGLVMDTAGVIYGTNSFQDDAWECGTVFRSSASDWYALHTFTGPDGCIPKSNLRLSNGWLVGTTSAGGASGQGTVFFLDTVSGAIHSYSLEGIRAGATAMGNLNIFGYGTTMSGGIYDGGTVYHLGPISKRLEGRYSFKLDGATGYAPMGDLPFEREPNIPRKLADHCVARIYGHGWQEPVGGSYRGCCRQSLWYDFARRSLGLRHRLQVVAATRQ
jgi:hypothetical protein